MVHVWITAHECGPFAALEVTVPARPRRTASASTSAPTVTATSPPRRRRPTGHRRLRPEQADRPLRRRRRHAQQRRRREPRRRTVVGLPQWSDPAVAEAAGFRSIGDSATGHEHYVDGRGSTTTCRSPPTPPRASYEPQPDGSKKLVSAMYMLCPDVALADVPDGAGPLMQWHVHDDLCSPTTRRRRGARDHTAGGHAGRRSSSTGAADDPRVDHPARLRSVRCAGRVGAAPSWRRGTLVRPAHGVTVTDCGVGDVRETCIALGILIVALILGAVVR